MAYRHDRPGPARAPERFALTDGPRALERLDLEHETLPPVVGCERHDDAVVLSREPVRGRRLDAGRVPRPDAAALLLQAAAASAFYASRGFPLTPPELEDAVWDAGDGGARLWLARTPGSAAGAANAIDASAAVAF